MPRLAPYAAHEIAMVSSTPAGSGLPIGLMPGALPSDHASRQTLKMTAIGLLFGHRQSARVIGVSVFSHYILAGSGTAVERFSSSMAKDALTSERRAARISAL